MNTDYYISLIYQQLQGTIGSEETSNLQLWERANPENQRASSEIRQAWKASEKHDLPFALDLDSDFVKVQTRLNHGEKPDAKMVQMNPRRTWLRVAAAVAFLLVMGLVFQNLWNKEIAWKNVTAHSTIEELQLPDGSKIWLNTGSTLSYPTSFSDAERPVKLSGEAFFEVAKDTNRPFQVFTHRTTITVLGTAFNVRDLEQETTTTVSVKEGKVKVAAIKNEQKITLIANEKSTYDESNNRLLKAQDLNLNDLAWQRKKLKFQETPFVEVAGIIAQEYQVSVTIRNQEMMQCLVSGQYNTATDVKNLLRNIAAIYEAEVTTLGEKKFEIIGGNCR